MSDVTPAEKAAEALEWSASGPCREAGETTRTHIGQGAGPHYVVEKVERLWCVSTYSNDYRHMVLVCPDHAMQAFKTLVDAKAAAQAHYERRRESESQERIQ